MRTNVLLTRATLLIGLLIAAVVFISPAGAITETGIPPIDSPAQTTPVRPVVKGPDKRHCSHEKYRKLVKTVYRKKKISKADHERIYQARRCLKRPKKALEIQRRASEQRKLRLDPWGHAWSQVPSGLKARLHRLKMCESTGNYRATNGPYTGAYQYHASTWARAGGSGQAMNAPPREQDVRTARFFPSHASEWECKA